MAVEVYVDGDQGVVRCRGECLADRGRLLMDGGVVQAYSLEEVIQMVYCYCIKLLLIALNGKYRDSKAGGCCICSCT